MKEIDLSTWNRREHFAFFRRADLPFYNVNTNVDISGLPACAKRLAVPFCTLLMYITVRALNSVENFRYRVRGESVVLHDALNPSFTYLRQGEELFRLITLDFRQDLFEFDEATRAAIAASSAYFDLSNLVGRDDFVFLSSMPWFSFTGTDHTLSLKRDDAIPRITWGKYFAQNGGTLLPFNIQVNHMFIDGLHVARFFEALGREIGLVQCMARPGSLPTDSSMSR